ncbi:MAG TPA: MlaD family protein [Solirubrobacteraceae bacterium]|nr:MlaD family protein [Solirubrobacteraceae bacterium]
MRNSSVIGRLAALAALGIAVVAVVVVLLSGGSSYKVNAIFSDAGQIVSGDQVEVGGNAIGTVSNIALTRTGQADLTLSLSNYTPLRQGTHATIRQASLSGIANRYVDLQLGPSNAPAIPTGGVIGTSGTTNVVDLDELFNTLNGPTRKGLQNVFQGSASEYAGKGRMAQLAWEYLNPALATSSELFAELNRDTSKFTKFVVNSSNLVTDLSQRQSDLSGLVSHLSTTFSALASQQVALGQSVQRLPPFMRLTNTTFVNLRNALGDLTGLINASRPVAPKLQRLLVQLRPLAVDSVPTIRNLANIISRPGANNDLIELNQLSVPLAQATVAGQFGEPLVYADGAKRPGSFTESTPALRQAVPELAVARPYAPDLTGWFEGYSHPGVYDANGAASRIALVVGLGSIQNGVLNILGSSPLSNLLTDPSGRAAFASGALTTGQGDRCPGSMERGPTPGTSAAPPLPSGFPCTLSEVPTGK